MDEQWKKIPGFPDYSVSNYGRIKRDTSKRGAQANHVLSQANHNSGYRFVVLRDINSKKINVYVHRAVALAFLGEPPSPKHEVAHWNGTRTDNCVSNLRWATRSENFADKRRHGTERVQAGEANVNAKLTAEIVAQIREDNAKGTTYSQLARKYGINRTHARNICLGLSWFKQGQEMVMPPKEMVG